MYLGSLDSQRQYPERLKLLFDYLGLEGNNDIEEEAQAFLDKAKTDQQWKRVAYKRELLQTTLVYYGNNKNREE
jgi:hypothetical protein